MGVPKVKRVTVNLPADVLANATRATGLGLTKTIIAGLLELQRSARRSALRELRGKIHFDLDLERSRR